MRFSKGIAALVALFFVATAAFAQLSLTNAGGVPGTFVQSFSNTVNSANSLGWNGWTMRLVIPASQLTQSGRGFRLTFKGGFEVGCSLNNTTINSAYAGHAAGAGDAYDFDGTQVQQASKGSTSFSITNPHVVGQSGSITLDPVSYTFDKSRNFVVAAFFGTAGADCIPTSAANVTGVSKWQLNANDAATTNPTGYAGPVADTVYMLSLIEVLQ